MTALGDKQPKEWSTDETSYLQQCLDNGMSCSQAANAVSEKFGTYRTRNAVIGRVHRRGLVQPSTKPQKPQPWKAAGIGRRAWNQRKQVAEGRMPPRKPKAKPMVMPNFQRETNGLRCVEVVPLHLPLLELESDQCRWPYGEGPYTFCGHAIIDGGSYCHDHTALAWGGGTKAERDAVRGVRRAA